VPQIEVTFSIDSNGIVSVSARDQATGAHQSIQINPAGGLSKDEIDRIINEAGEFQREDVKRKELRQLKNKLEGLIYTNEKVFREFGSLLKEEERNRVKDVLDYAKEALTIDHKQKVNDAIFELGSVQKVLTSVMLYNPSKISSVSSPPAKG
jgi:molecular chaperone DnaK